MCKKLAIYCTADDGYIVPPIIALTSIKRFHQDCSYFVIVDKNRISQKNVELLSTFGIKVIYFDGDYAFECDYNWPKECYWILYGPKIFWKLGFPYSMSVDGDTLCVQPLDLENLLPRIQGYAGIENLDLMSLNFEDPAFISQKFGLTEEVMKGHNTNTGVVFWNNQKVVESNLWEHSIAVYKECSTGRPNMFNGDQGLFALVSIIEPALPWLILQNGYNFRVGNYSDREKNIKEKEIRIYHYTGIKPWQPVPLKNKIRNPDILLHRDKWFKFVDEQEIFNRDLSIRNRSTLEGIVTKMRDFFDDLIVTLFIKLQVFKKRTFALCRRFNGKSKK